MASKKSAAEKLEDLKRKEDLINEFKKLSLSDMIKEMAAVGDSLESAEDVVSALQEKYDILRLIVLPSKMDDEDVSTQTVVGAGRVSLQGDIYFSIPADMRDKAYEWLRTHGHGDIIQETINSSTGKAWAKEVLKKGETLPEGVFKVTPFTRAQLTRIRS